MYRLRSSVPYEILHGVQSPTNWSALLSYMSYFPPPPPIIPGPPPSRSSRRCSSVRSPCFTFPDLSPPSLHHLTSSVNSNQSSSWTDVPSISIRNSSSFLPLLRNRILSSFDYLISLIQNHILFILISTTLIFFIVLVICLICRQRCRQRRSRSLNKNLNVGYHLIPRRRKHRTTRNKNEWISVRLRKDSPMFAVLNPPVTSGRHSRDTNQTEEVL